MQGHDKHVYKLTNIFKKPQNLQWYGNLNQLSFFLVDYWIRSVHLNSTKINCL